MKRCSKCGEDKHLSEFYTDKKRGKEYARSCCKQCQKKQAHEWHISNRDKWKVTERKSRLRLAYGITLSDYQDMLKKQNGLCAICGRDYKGKVLHVDHDHETNKIRGLLCHNCNMTLGLIHDDMNIAKKIIDYLEISKLKRLFA